MPGTQNYLAHLKHLLLLLPGSPAGIIRLEFSCKSHNVFFSFSERNTALRERQLHPNDHIYSQETSFHLRHLSHHDCSRSGLHWLQRPGPWVHKLLSYYREIKCGYIWSGLEYMSEANVGTRTGTWRCHILPSTWDRMFEARSLEKAWRWKKPLVPTIKRESENQRGNLPSCMSQRTYQDGEISMSIKNICFF